MDDTRPFDVTVELTTTVTREVKARVDAPDRDVAEVLAAMDVREDSRYHPSNAMWMGEHDIKVINVEEVHTDE